MWLAALFVSALCFVINMILSIDSIFNNKEASIFKNALLKCAKQKLHTENLKFKIPGSINENDFYECCMTGFQNNKGEVIGVFIKDQLKMKLFY